MASKYLAHVSFILLGRAWRSDILLGLIVESLGLLLELIKAPLGI
jgi:hypothetical protein